MNSNVRIRPELDVGVSDGFAEHVVIVMSAEYRDIWNGVSIHNGECDGLVVAFYP